MRSENPCLYETMELSPRVSPAVLKAAYRCLVQTLHPDRNPGDPCAAARLAEINQAYAVLSDPERRRAYDGRVRPAKPPVDRRGSKPDAPITAGHPGASDASKARRFAFRPLA